MAEVSFLVFAKYYSIWDFREKWREVRIFRDFFGEISALQGYNDYVRKIPEGGMAE